jgi:hypothetical protein
LLLKYDAKHCITSSGGEPLNYSGQCYNYSLGAKELVAIKRGRFVYVAIIPSE